MFNSKKAQDLIEELENYLFVSFKTLTFAYEGTKKLFFYIIFTI